MSNSGEGAHRLGVHRLTPDDDLFVRMERVLGVPVVNQIVWRFAGPIDPAALRSLQQGLAAGPLNRRFSRSRVPGARDRWQRADTAAPVSRSAGVVSNTELTSWIESEAAMKLDARTGPAWRLASAETAERGSVVSLVSSHVIGDGGALVSAVVAALAQQGQPLDKPEPSLLLHRIVTDLPDSARQVTASAIGIVRAITAPRVVRNTAPPSRSPRQHSHGAGSQPHASQPPTVFVDCPAAQWYDAADRHHASANTLLVAVLVGVLRASGRAGADDPVKVSLPVSTRTENDPRANATSGVSITVEGGAAALTDLASVRAQMKNAFASVSDPSVLGHLAPLMQMLPDRAVRLLVGSGSAPICLGSNLGRQSQLIRSIGGNSASSIAMRSITQNATPQLLRSSGSGVSGWWNDSGDVVTLCVTGLDPDAFPNLQRLTDLVSAEYKKWTLTPSFW